jgi:hypothetical protein
MALDIRGHRFAQQAEVAFKKRWWQRAIVRRARTWGVAVEFRVFAPLARPDEGICRLVIGGARRWALLAVSQLHAAGIVSAEPLTPLQRSPGAASTVISLNGRHAGHRWLGRQPDSWDLRLLPWVAAAWDLARRGLSGLSGIRSSPVTTGALAPSWPGG